MQNPTAPAAVNFRGKNHLASARTVRNGAGEARHLPACGSFTRRSLQYPYPTDEPVNCLKCLALAERH